MRLRQAKKIMACDVSKKTREERIPIFKTKNWYWIYRCLKYYTIHKIKDHSGILKCDHRITEAIRVIKRSIKKDNKQVRESIDL